MLRFLKPKWQHANADIRLNAVERSSLEESIILALARSDEDIRVRIAASQKISDLGALYSLWLSESKMDAKNVQIERMAELLDKDDTKKAVADFISTITLRSFPLAKLIIACKDKETQQTLFSKLESDQDFFELIKNSHWLQVEAIEKINNEVLLSEFLKSIRGGDKRTYRTVKERIDQLTKDKAHKNLRIELLASYKKIAQNSELAALNHFSDLEERWNQAAFGEDSDHTRFRELYLERYQNHMAMHNAHKEAVDQAKILLADEAPKAQLTQHIEALEALKTQVDIKALEEINQLQKSLQKGSVQEREEKQTSKANHALYREVDKLLIQPYQITPSYLDKIILRLKSIDPKTDESNQYLSKLEHRKQLQKEPLFNQAHFLEVLEEIERLLEKGEVADAFDQQKIAHDLLKKGYSLTKNDYDDFFAKLRTIAQPLREMGDWARWSSLKILEGLCVDAENLNRQENSANEYITLRLKQLRKDWQEALKTAGKQGYSLRKRFDHACEKAFKNVRDERKQNEFHREHYVAEAKALLAQLKEYTEQIDWNAPKWGEVNQTKTTFLREWNRYLAQYSDGTLLSYGVPIFLERDRRKLEREMRSTLAPLNERLKEEQIREKSRREALIKRLTLLNKEDNIVEAVEYAKRANRTFAPTIRLNHREENKLWNQLRAVCDQVFERKQNMLEVADSEREVNLTQKEALLIELQSLLSNFNGDQLASINDEIDLIQNRWHEIGAVPKKSYSNIEEQFKKNIINLKNRRQEFINIQKNQERSTLFEASKALSVMETAVLSRQDFTDIGAFLHNENEPLKKRYECLVRIAEGDQSALSHLQDLQQKSVLEARRLCVLKELLMERETPESDKELRMQLQIDLLENHLSGEQKHDQSRQLAQLDREWLANVVCEIPDDLVKRFCQQ